MTFNLTHARPHHDISTEFHTEMGPFTLVPLPGQRSSLFAEVNDRIYELLESAEYWRDAIAAFGSR